MRFGCKRAVPLQLIGVIAYCQFALVICQRHVTTDFWGRFLGASPVGTGAKYLFLDPHTIRVCL